MMKPVALRKGGIIKATDDNRLSPAGEHEDHGTGGLSFLKRSGCAGGGLVQGPGTGSSDSVPATIEDRQPVRLSNGEAVLNAEAVKLLGEDFIHRVNEAAFVNSRLPLKTRKRLPLMKTEEQAVKHEDIAGDGTHA
jgi:hypothetical protein